MRFGGETGSYKRGKDEEIGRDERIRTSGPSVPNAVLYQTEPRPDQIEKQEKLIIVAPCLAVSGN